MDDDELELEQSLVARFTDPAVRGRDELARAVFDKEFAYSRGEYSVYALLSQLRAMFEAEPAATRIMLVIDSERTAVAVRSEVLAAPATAGGPGGTPDLGSAERAALTGHSTRYRLLKFACGRPGCSSIAHASYHDDRCLPECTVTGHGPMRFVEVVR